ncbi:MAG: hypothetical protein IIV72_04615 [Alistipes sp.]|nr:hypothetical protein [Alistipes sp.]
MKKFLLFVMAAIAMVATSCTKEQTTTSVPLGEEVTVTFTADLGAIESRAIADGQKVNEVAWAIYLEGAAEPLADLKGVLPINNKQGVLEVRLVTGKSYDLAFFAYSTEQAASEQVNGVNPTPSYYAVDWNTKSITVEYPDGQIANDTDKRDCFWHVEKGLKVEGPVNKTFTLHRPLAQLNFGVTAEDTLAAQTAGLVVGESKIKASTYAGFNMFTGECFDQETVEYTFAQNTVPDQALTVQGTNYTYIGTVYLLVNDKMLQDVAITIYNESDSKEINTLEYSNVPMQRNYRTNILGALLTNPVKFNIIVDEAFEEPDYVAKHWDGTTKEITPDAEGVYNVTCPEELAWIAEQVNSGANNFEGKAIVIPEENEALDLNGLNNYVWTPIGTAKNPFRGSFDGNNVLIRNVVIKTPECAGLFGKVIGAGITNVNIDGITIEANHYAGAVAGYAYSNITYCTVKNFNILVTPNEVVTREAAYDNGDKVGGIVGYVGENRGEGYTINNNVVDGGTITGYRDLGGIAGAAYVKECKTNRVTNTTITVDQETNFYGKKPIYTEKFVGRVLGGTLGTNTSTTTLKFEYHPADLEWRTVKEVVAYKSNADVFVQGWVVAACDKSFVISDETGELLFVYNPKTASKVGAIVRVTGRAGTYGDSNLIQVNKNSTVTTLEQTVEVTYPQTEVWTKEQIDAYAAKNTRTFVKIKGALNISGTHYNIELNDAKVDGSLIYPNNDIKPSITALNGKTVIAEGYAVYTKSGYMNIVATKVEEYKVATEWGVVGDHNNWGATPDITMYTADNNLMFAKGVELQAGKKFKIRANNEWNDAKNWGMSTAQVVYSNMKLPVIVGAGSQDMTVLENGTYDIYFDLENKTVYLMEAGKSIDSAAEYERYEVPQYDDREWRLVGAFNDWNPNDDNYLMNLTEDNKWAVITTEFTADTDLKFAADGGWNFNFGNGVTVELGVEYPGYQRGQNIKVPAGKYKISLSMCDGRFKFEVPVVEVTKDISFANKAQRTTFNTTKQVWEQNGITVTNDKAASTSNVADYANPLRCYKSSNVKIEAPGKILSIVIDCSGLEAKYIDPWGTNKNKIVTITLDGTSNSYTFTKLSAQARAYKMTVTWLE